MHTVAEPSEWSERSGDGTVAALAATAGHPRRSVRGVAVGLTRSLRAKQWAKNVLVFAAPGAGGVLLHPHVLWQSGLAFAAFCAAASAGYLLNDLVDARSDRLHPVRRERPIAAGRVPPVTASLAVAALLAAAGTASIWLGWRFEAALSLYVAMSAGYSFALKRVAVVDIAVVAAGFVVRAVAGSAATGVPLSQWFLILVSSGALFVVAGKRYAEYAAMGDRIDDVRTPMVSYTAGYLRYVWMVASSVAVAAYCLWAFAQPHARHHVPWSELSAIPFVLAILRYALILETGRGGAPEDVLLGDRPLLALAAMWLAVYGCGVYLGR